MFRWSAELPPTHLSQHLSGHSQAPCRSINTSNSILELSLQMDNSASVLQRDARVDGQVVAPPWTRSGSLRRVMTADGLCFCLLFGSLSSYVSPEATSTGCGCPKLAKSPEDLSDPQPIPVSTTHKSVRLCPKALAQEQFGTNTSTLSKPALFLLYGP